MAFLVRFIHAFLPKTHAHVRRMHAHAAEEHAHVPRVRAIHACVHMRARARLAHRSDRPAVRLLERVLGLADRRWPVELA
eukprot:6187843-Pleurochrysis_carterae.AAC.4